MYDMIVIGAGPAGISMASEAWSKAALTMSWSFDMAADVPVGSAD